MQDILPLRSKQVRLVALRILNSSESPIRVIIHSWLETRWSSSSRLDQPWTLVSVRNGRRNHLIDFCGIIRTDDLYHPLQSLRARSGRISSRKDETAEKGSPQSRSIMVPVRTFWMKCFSSNIHPLMSGLFGPQDLSSVAEVLTA